MNKSHDPDDQEQDIADDPLLSALDRELGQVSKGADRNLILVLVGIGLPAMLAFQKFATGPVRLWGVAASVAVIIGAIPHTIWKNVSRKRQVAARFGLVCAACGCNPGATYALSTATVGRCRRCGTALTAMRVPGS